mmetsp:Transcript_33295/g.99060  ORF Transcript_33295/g.99060 Transcript_33295/m.99060 type:complete len:233 (+) Transcript_33295:580-1278(+)
MTSRSRCPSRRTRLTSTPSKRAGSPSRTRTLRSLRARRRGRLSSLACARTRPGRGRSIRPTRCAKSSQMTSHSRCCLSTFGTTATLCAHMGRCCTRAETSGRLVAATTNTSTGSRGCGSTTTMARCVKAGPRHSSSAWTATGKLQPTIWARIRAVPPCRTAHTTTEHGLMTLPRGSAAAPPTRSPSSSPWATRSPTCRSTHQRNTGICISPVSSRPWCPTATTGFVGCPAAR